MFFGQINNAMTIGGPKNKDRIGKPGLIPYHCKTHLLSTITMLLMPEDDLYGQYLYCTYRLYHHTCKWVQWPALLEREESLFYDIQLVIIHDGEDKDVML